MQPGSGQEDWACVDVGTQIADDAKAVSHVVDDDMAPMQAAQARFDACHGALNPASGKLAGACYQKLGVPIPK